MLYLISPFLSWKRGFGHSVFSVYQESDINKMRPIHGQWLFEAFLFPWHLVVFLCQKKKPEKVGLLCRNILWLTYSWHLLIRHKRYDSINNCKISALRFPKKRTQSGRRRTFHLRKPFFGEKFKSSIYVYDGIVKSRIWAYFIAYSFPFPQKIFRLFYETFYMLHLESKLTPEAKLHLLRRNTIWRRRKNRPNKTRSSIMFHMYYRVHRYKNYMVIFNETFTSRRVFRQIDTK